MFEATCQGTAPTFTSVVPPQSLFVPSVPAATLPQCSSAYGPGMRAAPIRGGVVLHRDQWLAAGVSDRRLGGAEFIRVLPGYFTSARSPADLNTICKTVQNTAIDGAVPSHTTAALLLGLPLPHWLENGAGFLATGASRTRGGLRVPSVRRVDSSAVDILPGGEAGSAATHGPVEPQLPPMHFRIPRDQTTRVRKQITLHRLPAGRTVLVDGLVVSHPTEVLLELASMLPHDDLVACMDAVVGPRARVPGITLAHIMELADRSQGRRGCRALRAAVADARPGVESPGETFTRLLLVRAGFPEPEPNVPVWDPVAESRRRIDNGYRAWKIGIEYDGQWRRTTNQQWRSDESRSDNLASIGWLLRRLTIEDLNKPEYFLDRLHATFCRRGIRPPPRERWHGTAGLDLGRRARSGPHLVGTQSRSAP